MMVFPMAIDNSITNVTFTRVVGDEKFVISQPIPETVGEPHDFLLQVVNSYEPLVWWLIHLTIMTLAFVVVSMSGGRTRRHRRTTSIFKRLLKKKMKPFIEWIIRFYMTILDRSQFETTNRKLTFIFGSTLLGIFLFNTIGMLDLGTKLIVPTSNLFNSMSDLLDAPPGRVSMAWNPTSFALIYFKSRSNPIANKIYQKHIERNMIIRNTFDVNLLQDKSAVVIESFYMWIKLRRYLCTLATNYFGKVIKARTIYLKGLRPSPAGYPLNRHVNGSVRTLVDQWYVL